MTDPHIEEWKKIKERYMKSEVDDEKTFNYIKFRIECIDELLSQEKEKELNHFR